MRIIEDCEACGGSGRVMMTAPDGWEESRDCRRCSGGSRLRPPQDEDAAELAYDVRTLIAQAIGDHERHSHREES